MYAIRSADTQTGEPDAHPAGEVQGCGPHDLRTAQDRLRTVRRLLASRAFVRHRHRLLRACRQVGCQRLRVHRHSAVQLLAGRLVRRLRVVGNRGIEGGAKQPLRRQRTGLSHHRASVLGEDVRKRAVWLGAVAGAVQVEVRAAGAERRVEPRHGFRLRPGRQERSLWTSEQRHQRPLPGSGRATVPRPEGRARALSAGGQRRILVSEFVVWPTEGQGADERLRPGTGGSQGAGQQFQVRRVRCRVPGRSGVGRRPGPDGWRRGRPHALRPTGISATAGGCPKVDGWHQGLFDHQAERHPVAVDAGCGARQRRWRLLDRARRLHEVSRVGVPEHRPEEDHPGAGLPEVRAGQRRERPAPPRSAAVERSGREPHQQSCDPGGGDRPAGAGRVRARAGRPAIIGGGAICVPPPPRSKGSS